MVFHFIYVNDLRVHSEEFLHFLQRICGRQGSFSVIEINLLLKLFYLNTIPPYQICVVNFFYSNKHNE